MSDRYLKAKKSGKKSFDKAVIKGHFPYIQALEDVLDQYLTLPKKRIGVLEIPINQIVGTTMHARSVMFSHDYLPLGEVNSEFAIKWENVLLYQEDEGINDPIKVYEYHHQFFVEEGNKRTSVLKYLDIPTVLADVTRIVDDKQDTQYEAFLSFFQCVGIYDIKFINQTHYKELAEIFGQDLDHKWNNETISKLKSRYYRFYEIAKKVMKIEEPEQYSEAFLLFLKVYGLDATYHITQADIRKIWKEMNFIYNNENRRIIEKPNEEDSTLGKIKNLVSINLNHKNVSFIYEADPITSSNVFLHELGRLMTNERMKNTIVSERYDNGSAKVIEEAIQKGAQIIITTSPELYDDTCKLAIKYPYNKFYNCSLYQTSTSVETYDIKMFEVKFLFGALAAMLAKNHTLGYIADAPVYGAIANINAFAIGASMVDSNAKIYLGWKETLDQDWQNQMRTLGIEVFSGPELPSFSTFNTEYGLYQLSEDAVVQVASPIINWDIYYEKLLKIYLEGNNIHLGHKAISYWCGMSANVLDIHISSRIPSTSCKMIEALKRGIIDGTLNPFDGRLYTNEGMIINENGALSAEEIITMHWLNENVIGNIPEYEELTGHGKHLIQIHGVEI